MEKPPRICAPNASPRPLFYFGKQSKTPLHDILKGDYQKPLKK